MYISLEHKKGKDSADAIDVVISDKIIQHIYQTKSQDIRKDVNQVIAAGQICKLELVGYNSFYRIIPGKVQAE